MAKGKKTGGRQKGTPNKITTLAKGMMQKWLEAHEATQPGDTLPLIMQDFALLDPRDRVKVSTEFIKIIMPRNVNVEGDEVRLTIEDRLIALCAAPDEDEPEPDGEPDTEPDTAPDIEPDTKGNAAEK